MVSKIREIQIPCWVTNGKRVSVKTNVKTFDRERLERAKCFNIICQNMIDYIRMKESGIVDMGYCSSCYERAKYRSLYLHFTRNRKGTLWFEIITGKLKEDKERW